VSNTLTISQNGLTITTSETLVNVLMVSESTVAGGAVTSVNGQDGVVVLDTDDISEGTNKFSTAANLTKLSGIDDGAEVNPDVISQAEAEAGTATTERTWTSQRVKQAIEALATGSVEFIDTEFRIVDSVSGNKQLFDTSNLTADRTLTYPDFDFDLNDWFEAPKTFRLDTLKFSTTQSTYIEAISWNALIYKVGATWHTYKKASEVRYTNSLVLGFSSASNPSSAIADATIARNAEAELLTNGILIQTDATSGYTLTPDLTELSADRTITYPDFDFDFGNYFDSNGNVIKFQNNVTLDNNASNYLSLKLGASTFYLFKSSIALQLNSTTKLGWCSGKADTTLDTTLERADVATIKTDYLLFKKPLINISALHTALATNHIINCTANTFTVTLPTAVGIQGKEYIVKNSGSGVITVDADGTETIDGDLTQSLNQYDSLTIVSDNTNWIII